MAKRQPKLTSESNSSTFAEVISENLKDKFVEVFFGEAFEVLKQADSDRNMFTTICGKLLGATGDVLILNCFYVDDNGISRLGNIVYINGYAIKAISEINACGSLHETFLSTIDSKKIHKTLSLNDIT